MLTRLHADNYKSLQGLDVAFPKLTVLFGPNAVGKSNILDAIVVLSRLANERTIADALSGPVRGYPFEQVTLPRGGLPELLTKDSARFDLAAEMSMAGGTNYRYAVGIDVDPQTGSSTVADERLSLLTRDGTEKGNPAVAVVDDVVRIRRKGKPAHPREEPLGLNHTQLSDTRWSGDQYSSIERMRAELSKFRAYYLDPRVTMRKGVPPREVDDIGPLGEHLAAFLHRLRSSKRRSFDAAFRALRSIIPSVDELHVDLDEKRGLLDIQIRQDGTVFSSRVLSEGTLRVLALCAIAANPWPGSLVAFEEPENGVHPRRLELIAELLSSLALARNQQVIVTTHSPLFCQQVLRLKRERPEAVELLIVSSRHGRTAVSPFRAHEGPLLDDVEIREALTSPEDQEAWFEGLMLKGLVDA
jgi:predicted ATPase